MQIAVWKKQQKRQLAAVQKQKHFVTVLFEKLKKCRSQLLWFSRFSRATSVDDLELQSQNTFGLLFLGFLGDF